MQDNDTVHILRNVVPASVAVAPVPLAMENTPQKPIGYFLIAALRKHTRGIARSDDGVGPPDKCSRYSSVK